MGKVISKKNNVEVINHISINDLKRNPHLVAKDEIIITNDNILKIPEVDIRLDNYFPSIVRLRPGDSPTPPPKSCSSYSILDSGVDTVN